MMSKCNNKNEMTKCNSKKVAFEPQASGLEMFLQH